MRARGLRSRGIERRLACSAIARIAFRAHQDVSIPERSVTRLNTLPTSSPVNASHQHLRAAVHDSGADRFARPYLHETYTHSSDAS